MTDITIFTKIWVYPRHVFSFIDETRYRKYLYLIVFISGTLSALQRMLDKGLETDNITGAILLSMLIGGLFGWIGSYIYAALIRFTGEWLNGKASTDKILAVMIYGSIPQASALIIYIIQLYLIKNNYFETSISEDTLIIINYSLVVVKFILIIWSLVLYIVGISEVQKLTIIKATLNFFLPILIIVVPIGALIMIATSLA